MSASFEPIDRTAMLQEFGIIADKALGLGLAFQERRFSSLAAPRGEGVWGWTFERGFVG